MSTRTHLRRLTALLCVFSFALVAILVRLAVLQVGEHDRYQLLGLDQRSRTVVLPAQRGEILDRDGTPLAMSTQARDIYVDQDQLSDPAAAAAQLAPLLGLREAEVARTLEARGPSFRYVARQVDPAVAARIARLRLAGVGSLPVTKRYYPAGALAPQVLGFVGLDGSGLSGLEYQYDDLLGGKAGSRVEEVDPSGDPIAQGVSSETPPVAGSDVVTTLDRPLQYQVQQALEAAVKANSAKGGTVIVMDPHTGDIEAMATYPWFDPNRFMDYDPARLDEIDRNRAVTDAFEPGSVNKVITVSAAIQEHAVPIDERISVASSIQVGDSVIHDAESHPLERMTVGDILAHSSNVGTIHIADMLGSGPLATYLARFGFGRPTGIGFPGESSGVLLPLYQWSDTSRATMSFGQGISATPLQMAAVYATVANDGTYVQPRLLQGTVGVNGSYRRASPSPTHEVISPDSAKTVTKMLAYAVEDGTGKAATVAGYQVAGKTGTARIPSPSGGYLHGKYMASFMGFLPASNPRVVIVATLDEPATIFGGVAAAPLFAQVARFAIQRLGIAQGHHLPLPPHALPAG
jgi:cell division protein FtsI (penicillin-binding protein 3)